MDSFLTCSSTGPTEERQDLDQELLAEKLTRCGSGQDTLARRSATAALRCGSLSGWFCLQIVDALWKEHLLNMDHLKEGIGLRGYGQKNPLNEYKREGFNLFSRMVQTVKLHTSEQSHAHPDSSGRRTGADGGRSSGDSVNRNWPGGQAAAAGEQCRNESRCSGWRRKLAATPPVRAVRGKNTRNAAVRPPDERHDRRLIGVRCESGYFALRVLAGNFQPLSFSGLKRLVSMCLISSIPEMTIFGSG